MRRGHSGSPIAENAVGLPELGAEIALGRHVESEKPNAAVGMNDLDASARAADREADGCDQSEEPWHILNIGVG